MARGKGAAVDHSQPKAKRAKLKRKNDMEKAEKLGTSVQPKRQRTIENSRVKDDTMVEAEDPVLLADFADDEFADYFRSTEVPKVLITTCYKTTRVMYSFLTDFMEMLPNAHFYKRRGYPVKKIVEYAIAEGFTNLLVFNEDQKAVNGLLMVHLPGGPTAHFKLSSIVLSKAIKGHGRPTKHKPEIILNRFGTRVGTRIGRLLASLYPQQPQFRGRQVATFHNQRDFIFFRHHRYVFEEKDGDPDKAKDSAVISRLQELGPRFTMKLLSLQRGTFDSKTGEYEWVFSTRMAKNRLKFSL